MNNNKKLKYKKWIIIIKNLSIRNVFYNTKIDIF